jgi:hypothetical protein
MPWGRLHLCFGETPLSVDYTTGIARVHHDQLGPLVAWMVRLRLTGAQEQGHARQGEERQFTGGKWTNRNLVHTGEMRRRAILDSKNPVELRRPGSFGD